MKSGTSSRESTRGLIAALACYVVWGVVPIYWKQMAQVDPIELVAHRVAWSLFVLGALARLMRFPDGAWVWSGFAIPCPLIAEPLVLAQLRLSRQPAAIHLLPWNQVRQQGSHLVGFVT